MLAHAPALAALLNPTINSYKRFGPDTLAPWLIDWGLDNRSAMVRIPPERGRASRMELRLGDASANPYLAIAAFLGAAYLGIRDKLEPPAKLEGYGYDTSKAEMLPGDLSTGDRRARGRHGAARPARAGVRHRVRDLQAQRARAVLALGDRLGVPRVQLPPLSEQDVMQLLVIQHDHASPLGPVAERFVERGFDLTMHPRGRRSRRSSRPASRPTFPDFTRFDAVVPMGAPWSTYDHELIGSWVRPEIEQLRRADARRRTRARHLLRRTAARRRPRRLRDPLQHARDRLG